MTAFGRTVERCFFAICGVRCGHRVAFLHVRQVHGVDPVFHPARAPQVLPLDTAGGLAFLLLTGLIQRPDPYGARLLGRRAASSRPATANRRTTPIAAKVSQAAWFSSRCVRSGVRSPACSATLQPFRFGRPLITARTYFPACSHRLRPHKRRPHQPQQLGTFPLAKPRTYPDGSSRLRFCCSHKRMIARRLRCVEPAPSHPAAGHGPKCGCRTSWSSDRSPNFPIPPSLLWPRLKKSS